MYQTNLKNVGVAAVLALTILTGCGSEKTNNGQPAGKGNAAAYQAGGDNLCSSQFISDTNALGQVRVTSDPTSLDAADRIVDSYLATYRDVNCKARANGTDTYVSANDIAARAKQSIADYRRKTQSTAVSGNTQPNPNPVVNPSISTIDMNAPVANGFTMQVDNSDQMNRLAAGGTTIIVQKGVTTPLSSITNKYDNLCFIDYTSGATRVEKGERLVFSKMGVSDQMKKLLLVSDKISIGCMRLDGRYQSWTAKDLQDVFQGLATIVPTVR